MNCDDIYMCVVNKQFELLEFVFDSFYAGMQYYCCVCVLVLCLYSCGRLWSVCEFVVVRYVDAVVAVTVMCVLLFLLCVCMLRVCEGARVTAILVWGWMRCGECR